MKAFTLLYRWTAALGVMLVTGSVSLVLVLVSFGALRNFCSRHIVRHSSLFILWATGYRGVVPDLSAFPTGPAFYTFNHNSFLDIFLLTGVGLPNLRFILSTNTLKYVPLVISAKALGTFYIATKAYPEKRLRFFVWLTAFLKRTKLSVAASSEGAHDYVHGIAPFNRGVYHMAMEAGLPVVPLFICIPEECNVLKGDRHATGGTLRLEILPTVDTKSWKLETLGEHIAEVRGLYVRRFNELNPAHPTA